MICADDATGRASITSANKNERMEWLRILSFPFLAGPRFTVRGRLDAF
jgi:hypothetical protein